MIILKILGRVISKDNEKVFNRQGRPYLSKRFKDYAQSVAAQAKTQIKKPVEGDIIVDAVFFFKNRVHSDLQNLPKSLFDALNKIAWVDDRQIKICTLEVKYKKDVDEGVVIGITRCEDLLGIKGGTK